MEGFRLILTTWSSLGVACFTASTTKAQVQRRVTFNGQPSQERPHEVDGLCENGQVYYPGTCTISQQTKLGADCAFAYVYMYVYICATKYAVGPCPRVLAFFAACEKHLSVGKHSDSSNNSPRNGYLRERHRGKRPIATSPCRHSKAPSGGFPRSAVAAEQISDWGALPLLRQLERELLFAVQQPL